MFWRSVKPIFSEKYFSIEKITLIDDNNIVSDDNSLAITFNDFFANALKALDVKINPAFVKNVDDIRDPVMKEIKRYESHPSILKKQRGFRGLKTF